MDWKELTKELTGICIGSFIYGIAVGACLTLSIKKNSEKKNDESQDK